MLRSVIFLLLYNLIILYLSINNYFRLGKGWGYYSINWKGWEYNWRLGVGNFFRKYPTEFLIILIKNK